MEYYSFSMVVFVCVCFYINLKKIFLRLQMEFDITVSYSTMSLRTEKQNIIESYAQQIAKGDYTNSLNFCHIFFIKRLYEIFNPNQRG